MGLAAIVLNQEQVDINEIKTLCPMKVDFYYKGRRHEVWPPWPHSDKGRKEVILFNSENESVILV